MHHSFLKNVIILKNIQHFKFDLNSINPIPTFLEERIFGLLGT